jgi:hypothetical protein
LYAATVYQASALSRRRDCFGFFFCWFLVWCFLVFCFVGGGLLPLLKVAFPERPGKFMANGKAVIAGVRMRNETKAKEPNAKKSRRGPHATMRNDTKPEVRNAKGKNCN